MNLESTVGPDRAAVLRERLLGALEAAYEQNCERFSDSLGDNNVTFGVSVLHNLRHLVEEALDDEPGFRTSRRRGSFEISVDGLVALHLYKAKRGLNGAPEMIRLDDSQTKIELVARNRNPNQLQFSFEEPGDPAELVVRELLLLHVGDHDDGFDAAFIGAPSYSPVNGHQWLWLESLDGSQNLDLAEVSPPQAVDDVIFGSGELPSVEVEVIDDLQARRERRSG